MLNPTCEELALQTIHGHWGDVASPEELASVASTVEQVSAEAFKQPFGHYVVFDRVGHFDATYI